MKEKSNILSKKTSAVSKAKPKSSAVSKAKPKSSSGIKSKINGTAINKNPETKSKIVNSNIMPNKEITKNKIKSKTNSGSKKTKPKTQSSKLKKGFIIACTFVLLLGGSLCGYFIWQNNIFYTISFAHVEGFELTYDSLSVKNGEDFSFKLELKQDFVYYDELFQVTANGIKLEEFEQEFTITNVKRNIEILVEGVGTKNLQIANKTLTGSNSTSANLVIPYGVDTIAEEACKSKNTITKVVIPDSVKIIGDKAFNSCVYLSEIVFGKNVERIGYAVFEQTTWLTNKVDGLVYLGNWFYLFKGSSASKNFIIKDGIVGIASHAFIFIPNIESIELPNSLKYICNYAFSQSNLTALNLPNGIEFIGNAAFALSKIQGIAFPSSLIELGDDAFVECTSLKNVTFESEILLGVRVFAACANLETVYFAKGLKYISENLFVSCAKLSNITINSEKVPVFNDSYASYVFYGADIDNLRIYVIPSKVKAFKTSPGWSLYSDNIFAIPKE